MSAPVSADTIFALATAPGRAAVAVMRVSGPDANKALVHLAGSSSPVRTAAVRLLRDADGALIDQALVLRFAAPDSFTGEDVVEFQTHGGRAVVQALAGSLAQIPGLRPAEPGEFTRRALLNGKLDLTQAEAIADLIDSDTDRQRIQALSQLGGALARAVEGWKRALLDALSTIEAELDFVDEHDVSELDAAALQDGIVATRTDMAQQLAHNGRERLREGFTVVIAGPPNAGKSTLLNWWAGRDAAIVTPVAGTTRDLIEVDLDLDGIPVRFVDTAGLRDTDDAVERIGVARARERAGQADLMLWLHPEGTPPPENFGLTATLRVRTKVDSAAILPYGDDWLAVSVHTGAGLDALRVAVVGHLDGQIAQHGLITRERHRRSIADACEHLGRASQGLATGGPLEFVAEDLRMTLRALDGLIGRVSAEDVLDGVFSSFCIGK